MEPHDGGPDTQRWSIAVNLFIMACILASSVLVIVEHATGGGTGRCPAEVLWAAEVAFTAVFTVEYLLRWYAAPDRLTYPLGFYAVIDLLAIVPSFILLSHVIDIAPGFLALRLLRVARLLRVLRLVRLLKIVRHGNMIFRLMLDLRVWLSAVRDHYHLDRLVRLLAWTALTWVLGANVVWVTESTLAGASTPYSSYWPSYWNVIVVLVSGMDAETPVTVAGMVEVTLLLLAGICIVGLLTGEIVSIIVRSAARRGKLTLKPPGLALSQHIVVLGTNRHLPNVITQIAAALQGPSHLVVVSPEAGDIEQIDAGRARRVMALAGDPSSEDVLREACVSEASRVIVLSSDRDDEPCRERDNRALMHALAVQARAREVPLVVELQELDSLRYARTIPTAECIVRHEFGEKLIGQAVLCPGVTALYTELLTFTDDSNELYVMDVPRFLAGWTFARMQRWFMEHDEETILPVGIDRSAGETRYTRFDLHPDGAEVLGPGDRLIVMAYEPPSYTHVTEEDLWSGRTLARS
jgi:voltage-gated potassium channel